MRCFLKAVLALSLIAPTSAALAATDCAVTASISWKVEGGFAVFKSGAAAAGDALLDDIAAAHGRMQPDQPGTTAYDQIRTTLADDKSTPAPAGKAMYEQTLWDRASEQYIVDSILNPTQVTILASTDQDGDCRWSVDSGVQVRLPCRSARLSLPRTNGKAGRIMGQITAIPEHGTALTTCAFVEERLLIGLGDSYASGEGNPDRPTRWSEIDAVNVPAVAPLPHDKKFDTAALWDRRANGPLANASRTADAQWWDNSCHRSLLSAQALAAMSYAAHDRHRRVLFLSFACSGATIFDGVVGPRLEAPGANRIRGHKSVALQKSQINQLVDSLCAPEAKIAARPLQLPDDAPTWQFLKIRDQPTPKLARSLMVAGCGSYLRRPDALMLSIGGNDVGFGGVGAWAIIPPIDRAGLPVKLLPLVNRSVGNGAVRRGFGMVCPMRDASQKRCRNPPLTAAQLLGELGPMFAFMNEALNSASLSDVAVKLQTEYPPVSRDQAGLPSGCLQRLERERGDTYYANEPWMPQYDNVLSRRLLFHRMDWRGRWGFDITDGEMALIDHQVLAKLNQKIDENTGWTVVKADALPATHGVCAESAQLAALDRSSPSDLEQARSLALREFGWPRYAHGWTSDRPSPLDWHAYDHRARWFRTATDSALTQSVFDKGTAAPKIRKTDDRVGEGTNGTIHPTLEMHTAIGELLAAALEQSLRN